MRKMKPFPAIRASGHRGWGVVPTAASAALLIAAAMLGAHPAAAQSAPQCAARETVLEGLASKYDEHPVNVGVTSSGTLLEVVASPAGTWTIIVTVPGGPTCLVSSGDGWHKSPVQLAEDPGV